MENKSRFEETLARSLAKGLRIRDGFARKNYRRPRGCRDAFHFFHLVVFQRESHPTAFFHILSSIHGTWTTTPPGQRRQQQPLVRELYDENDEGFEITQLDDDAEDDDGDWDDAEWEEEDGTSLQKDPRMKITHVPSPKPAGSQ